MTENEALLTENQILKNKLGQAEAKEEALSRTVTDLLQANINLKTENNILLKTLHQAHQDNLLKDAKIKDLEALKESKEYKPELNHKKSK